MSRVAWFIISALIFCGDQVGCSCRSSAATPEMCGAAIDVPLDDATPFPVPTAADWMS